MKLDDFESVFRSAVKERFRFEAPVLSSVLLVTDLDEHEARQLEEQVRGFLAHGTEIDALTWNRVGKGDYKRVSELIAIIEQQAPDLIVTYRHLLGREKDLAHSLGSFVDCVSQMTTQPVLLLPPLSRADFAQRLSRLDRVLVMTDHIIGDTTLVNWGVHLCPDKGTVVLAHVEDDATFARYSKLIAMIPDAPTDIVLARLQKKLLGRPADYIESIVEALRAQGRQETVVPVVTMGHALRDYRRIIDEHDIDLLIMNTKDEQQLAMHGMAYAMSVEIQDRPLLLL